MTQEQTIVWHKYPDEKLENGKLRSYLTTRKYNQKTCWVVELVWLNDWVITEEIVANTLPLTKYPVIAWAHLPKGWKEE